jgi:hypothetical protein
LRRDESRVQPDRHARRWLGISWGDDAHQKNPDWRAYQRRSDENAAEMIDAIVADPYERLVPRGFGKRAEIAEAADKLRTGKILAAVS